MTTILEGDLKFDFPNGWQASKLDGWSFYRTDRFDNAGNVRMVCKDCSTALVCQNCKKKIMRGGAKCVDILAIENSVCWLIEIKDYRLNTGVKVIEFRGRDGLESVR